MHGNTPMIVTAASICLIYENIRKGSRLAHVVSKCDGDVYPTLYSFIMQLAVRFACILIF